MPRVAAASSGDGAHAFAAAAGLAACVNVLPMMTSVFRWEGNIEQGHEQQLVIKTAAGAIHASPAGA